MIFGESKNGGGIGSVFWVEGLSTSRFFARSATTSGAFVSPLVGRQSVFETWLPVDGVARFVRFSPPIQNEGHQASVVR